MLYLQLTIDQNRYVINTRQIISIIPLLKMHKMVGVPDYMAGLISYRGQTIPVVDLTRILTGKKSKQRLSTRIVLVNYTASGAEYKAIGFVAEKATEVKKLDDGDFTRGDIENEAATYLGAIASDADGMMQQLDIRELIVRKVHEHVYRHTSANRT